MNVRSLLLVAAVGLGAYWYVNDPAKRNIVPDAPQGPVAGLQLVLDSQVETFPQAPTEAVQKLLEPLNGIYAGHPNDALEMARAWKHWGKALTNNPTLTDLNQFNQVKVKALDGLFKGSLPLEASYDGRISPTDKAVYNYYLAPLTKDGEGNVTTIKIDPSINAALRDYFNAMSWKASQEWLKEVSKKEVK